MIQTAHIDAQLPPEYAVLGLRLRPFCVGHFLILSADTPTIFEPESPVKDTELLYAIFVCANTFEDARDFRSNGSEQAHKWIRKVLTAGLLNKRRKIDLREKRALFNQYLESGLTIPKFWQSDGPTVTLGSHWTEHLVVTLMAYLRFSESEAMNMFLPLARRRYMTYWEIQNSKKILYSQQDEEDEKFAREMERMRNGSGNN